MSAAADDAQTERARVHAAGMLASQLRMQDGIATYAQLVAGGVTRIDIERRLRRNELRRVHPRVYADHTGPLTWTQRAWAAVLYAEPAFLCWTSLEQPKGRDLDDPIHVAIDKSRRVRPQEGLVIHRLAALAPRTYGGTPPRLNVEDNALLIAHEARNEIDAIAALARVASRTYVTADSLRAALGRYPSLRRRPFIAGIIDDLEAGTHSVTARLRWHQVFDTPCRTAARVGRILARNGWTGSLSTCGDRCVALRS